MFYSIVQIGPGQIILPLVAFPLRSGDLIFRTFHQTLWSQKWQKAFGMIILKFTWKIQQDYIGIQNLAWNPRPRIWNSKPLKFLVPNVEKADSTLDKFIEVVNPERYRLVTDDPAFCKTIGDICDADGFVKPEDAYCTK